MAGNIDMKVSGKAQINMISAVCFALAVLLTISRIRNYTSELNSYWFQSALVIPIAMGASALALWCGFNFGRRLLQFITGIVLVMGGGWLIAETVRDPSILGLGMMPKLIVLVIFAFCFWTLTFSKSLEKEIQHREEKHRIT